MSEDKERERKLALAKLAYADIMKVINRWADKEHDIFFHWGGCISIDEELFHESQLREKEKE